MNFTICHVTFSSAMKVREAMKLATQSLILLVAMTVVTSALGQSPNNATRQRRSGAENAQPGSPTQPGDDKKSDAKTADPTKIDTTTAEIKMSDPKTASDPKTS